MGGQRADVQPAAAGDIFGSAGDIFGAAHRSACLLIIGFGMCVSNVQYTRYTYSVNP